MNFLRSAYFFKSTFSKASLDNSSACQNILDLGQVGCFVQPDLGPKPFLELTGMVCLPVEKVGLLVFLIQRNGLPGFHLQTTKRLLLGICLFLAYLHSEWPKKTSFWPF